MRAKICACLGLLCSALSALFGGFDGALLTLLLFMCIDFACGVALAALFGKSTKSIGGHLSSGACYRGLCKKFAVLAIVLIAVRLDSLMGSDYIRDTVIYCYLFSEGLSITENLALMGVPIPDPVKKALEVMGKR